MKNEFIPYKESLALKELGFDDKCLRVYNKKKSLVSYHYPDKAINRSVPLGYVTAPLYQQAFRWFREKHGLNTSIVITQFGQWWCKMKGSQRTGNKYDTYEEAELACLRKLIEIVKEKENEQE